MTTMSKPVYLSSEPEFKATTKELENHYYYYGKGMQTKFIKSNKEFLNYIGTKYGESEKQSVLQNKLVITEMSAPVSYATKEAFEKLDYTAQQDWKDDRLYYRKYKMRVETNLNMICSLLWSLCHVTLMNKIGVDKDYLAMRNGNAGELYRIIGAICNGSNSVDHPLRSGMETMFRILCIRGDDFTSRSSYYESFVIRAEAAEKEGWCMGTESLRNAYMIDLHKKGKSAGVLYIALFKWNEGADESSIMAGRVLLHEKMKALLFIRNSGIHYKNLRNELENDYTKGIDSYPDTVIDANHRLEYWRPLTVPNVRTGDSHYQGEGQDDDKKQSSYRKKSKCFKCDEEGHLSKDCTNKTKKDGSPLNTSEQISKMFDEIENRTTKKEPETNESE